MKANELGRFVKTLVDLLSKSGSRDALKAWRELIPLFSEKPDATITQIAKAISKVEAENSGYGVQVSQILILVPELVSFLEVSAKKDFISDITTLAEALKPHAGYPVTVVVRSALQELNRPFDAGKPHLRTQLIDRYITHLETYLFNADRFKQVIIELESKEAGLTGPELIQIAKDFTAETTKSKREAIEAIEARRDVIMGGEIESIQNRSRTAA